MMLRLKQFQFVPVVHFSCYKLRGGGNFCLTRTSAQSRTVKLKFFFLFLILFSFFFFLLLVATIIIIIIIFLSNAIIFIFLFLFLFFFFFVLTGKSIGDFCNFPLLVRFLTLLNFHYYHLLFLFQIQTLFLNHYHNLSNLFHFLGRHSDKF